MSDDNELVVDILGTIAVLASSISLVPQILQINKTGNVKSFSIFFPVLLIISQISWIAYHILKGTYHGLVLAICWLLFSVYLFALIIDERYVNHKGYAPVSREENWKLETKLF
jgi:uncharacterized protein with PQ loop repeat